MRECTQEAQNTENETCLGISRFYLNDLLYTFLGQLFYLFSALLIAVNEVNSKHSQISRSMINFQEKFSFARSSSALEKRFQIQALFKEFKDLHKPWKELRNNLPLAQFQITPTYFLVSERSTFVPNLIILNFFDFLLLKNENTKR